MNTLFRATLAAGLASLMLAGSAQACHGRKACATPTPACEPAPVVVHYVPAPTCEPAPVACAPKKHKLFGGGLCGKKKADCAPAPVACEPAPVVHHVAPTPQCEPAPVVYHAAPSPQCEPAPVVYEPTPVACEPAPVACAPKKHKLFGGGLCGKKKADCAPAPVACAPAPVACAPAPVVHVAPAPTCAPAPKKHGFGLFGKKAHGHGAVVAQNCN